MTRLDRAAEIFADEFSETGFERLSGRRGAELPT
jgi:hypothetical protein